MANFIQLLIGVTLVFTIVFLVNVNSLPTTNTSDAILPPGGNTLVNDNHTCFNGTDCNNHGQCRLNETGCDCERGWITHDNGGDTSKYCIYRQRSKLTAFIVSLSAGVFGADWFYLSRAYLLYIITGTLKLALGCGCCLSWLLIYFVPEIQNSESVKSKLRVIGTLLSLVAFAWWIVDWARILGNRFPDGNGAGLIPW
jgi:hypothetical protein